MQNGNTNKPMYAMAMAILLMGIFSIILQIAGIINEISLAEAGTGIWCGIFFILNGAFGIAAAKGHNKCTIVVFLVLSIITAAVFAVTQLTITSIGVAEDDYDHDHTCGERHDDNYWWPYRSCDSALAGIWLNSILLILAGLIGIMAIIGSALSCCALCRPSSRPGQGVVAHQVIAPSYIPQAGTVVLVPSSLYPGHYTIASNQVGIAQTPMTQVQAPPSYDNYAYRSHVPSTYPVQTPANYPVQTPANYQVQTPANYQVQAPANYPAQATVTIAAPDQGDWPQVHQPNDPPSTETKTQ